MNIEPTVPTTKNPPAQFAGDVWLDPIALPHGDDQTMVVATVRFAPGARTAWHSHQHGQYLRSPKVLGASAPETERSSKSTPARRSTPRPAKSTGTRPPPAASWNTSPCSKTARTPPKPPLGASTSTTTSTTVANRSPSLRGTSHNPRDSGQMGYETVRPAWDFSIDHPRNRAGPDLRKRHHPLAHCRRPGCAMAVTLDGRLGHRLG